MDKNFLKKLRTGPTKRLIQNKIPITKWFLNYSKFDAVSDLVAGITVGLTMIPQSIAYASLASLPAQYGLYTAFIGSFTYIFFGTIKQVSIGPTSLMSMLTYSYVHGFQKDLVILLTFVAGCVELIMGVFKLGFLVEFISPSVTSGFTSATSIIIIISQLGPFFGIKIKSHELGQMIIQIFQNITSLKIGDTALGVFCLIFLFAFKQLPKIPVKNQILKKTLWFLSISRNAITVLITALIGFYFFHTQETVPFVLSGKVPSGLPAFGLPSFSTEIGNRTVGFVEMIHSLGSGVIVLPVCAVLANVAIAKSFTTGVVVDASQEMMTLGLCNLFGSCVQAMPSCGAFSRSAVANSSGVRTPFQGIYSGTIIILALSFLTPYFYYIPKATLAAVLISAVTSLIDYEIIPILWKVSKYDFWMCTLTCGLGVIFGADIGIIIGAILNLIILLKVWARPQITKQIETQGKGREYIWLKLEMGLCYPSVDYVSQQVLKAHKEAPDLPIVIDCENLVKIDYAGAQVLKELLNIYTKNEVGITLINVNPTNMMVLESVLDKDKLNLCQNASFDSFELSEYKVIVDHETPLLSSETTAK